MRPATRRQGPRPDLWPRYRYTLPPEWTGGSIRAGRDWRALAGTVAGWLLVAVIVVGVGWLLGGGGRP